MKSESSSPSTTKKLILSNKQGVITMADNKYDLLKSPKKEADLVRQYADLLNEIRVTSSHLKQLEALAGKHANELNSEVWQTADGRILPITDMENDHLANAMAHLVRTGRSIPERMVEEAHERKITLPANSSVDYIDQDDDWSPFDD
jgi:hypothetical protein